MALINLGLNLIPVLVFLLISGGRPELSWRAFPVVIAFVAVFAFGLAMLLSSLFVRYRDIEPIWDVILQTIFYASGIFFSIDAIGDKLPSWLSQNTAIRVIMSNPFAAGLQEARHVFISPTYPSVAGLMEGFVWVLIPIGIAVAAIISGYRVFIRTAPTIAEDLEPTARDRRRQRLEDVRHPAQRRAHAQGAGPAPFRRQRSTAWGAARRDVRGAQGRVLGIVGRNGSGKSTLLKCMAGIYRTDRGQIYVDGRVSTFIELGVGFNPDLAARDNILINATMLGLSPKEARDRSDRIIDFAELHEFVDLKVKNYSSGMLVRLAFSVMIQVDADVLLIDEVLAVGDAAFQQKCFEEFTRIRRSDATVVLVTHDMGSVDRFCDHAILLEHGRMVDSGIPREVGNRYLELNFSRLARMAEAQVEAEQDTDQGEQPATLERSPRTAPPSPDDAPVVERRSGDTRADITDAWFETADGRAEVLPTGTPATFAMRVRFDYQVESPVFDAELRNTDGETVLVCTTRDDRTPAKYAAGEEIEVRFAFDNYLGPDRYTVTASVAREGSGLAWLDHRETS
jgi:ABC-type polysaccharide/polyol phosphate transport system ATPase subunit